MVLLKTKNEQSGLFKVSLVLKFFFGFWSFGFYLVFLPTVMHSGCNLSADVQNVSFLSMEIKLKLKQLFNFKINVLLWTKLVTLRFEKHSILQ
jgi:hypothetical protein